MMKTETRKLGNSALAALILAMSTARAEPPVEAGFSPGLQWDHTSNVAEISWPTVPGKNYHLQRSTSLQTWNTLAEIYGTGSSLTVRVQEAAPGTPSGGNAPETVVSASFVISPFQENQRELLSMPGGRRVLLEPGTITVPVPQFLSVSVPGAPEFPPTPVVALRADRPWNEVYALDPALSESTLTPEEAALRDLFVAAIVLNHNGGGVPAPVAVTGGEANGGPGVFYRVGVEDQDTDGDGLADWREFELGLDAWLVDSDGDGVGDGDEVNLGSDPNDPSSVPQFDLSTPQGEAAHDEFYNKYQYGTIFLDGDPSLLFITEADEQGSRLLPLLPGPGSRVRAFEVTHRYTFRLSLEDVTEPGQSATLAVFPTGPSHWKWWAQIGPNGPATTTGNPYQPWTIATASLVPVEFRGSQPCNGFDETESPRWQSVPALSGSTGNNVRDVIFVAPPDVIDQFEFIFDDPQKALIDVGPIDSGQRTLTLTGLMKGDACLSAVYTAPNTTSTTHDLMIDVLPRQERKLTIWAITNVDQTNFEIEGGGTGTFWDPTLDPSPTPSDSLVESRLNELWGHAANTHFTVISKSRNAHYDLAPAFDKRLGELEEYYAVRAPDDLTLEYIDDPPVADYNLYFVNQLREFGQAGYTRRIAKKAYLAMEKHSGERYDFETLKLTLAHEAGHLLGRADHSEVWDTKALMHESDMSGGCEIRRVDWKYVNP